MRILPPHLFYASLALTGASLLLQTGRGTIPQPYGIGLAMLAVPLGLVMNLSSVGQFRNVGTNLMPHLDPQQMVNTGWFRYSRNPMYLGMVVILVGAAAATGNVYTLSIPALFALVLDRLFIPREERAMLRIFGDGYASYRQRTRRWI